MSHFAPTLGHTMKVCTIVGPSSTSEYTHKIENRCANKIKLHKIVFVTKCSVLSCVLVS